MRNSNGLFFALLLSAMVALIAPIHLLAQSGAGSILGSVRDTTGAVVRGATVIVTNTATNVAMTVASNAAGDSGRVAWRESRELQQLHEVFD